jgi:exosortase F-associated protein
MLKSNQLQPDRSKRLALIVFCFICLGLVFIFQKFDYSQLILNEASFKTRFIFNRSLRFLMNDNLMLLLIYALFYQRKYVRFGLIVELFGLLFLLIPYFILRFSVTMDHMYISFLHRLIVNPTLMVLLILAIYIQENKVNTGK